MSSDRKLTSEGRCTFSDGSVHGPNPPGISRTENGWPNGRIVCECAGAWGQMSEKCYYYEPTPRPEPAFDMTKEELGKDLPG